MGPCSDSDRPRGLAGIPHIWRTSSIRTLLVLWWFHHTPSLLCKIYFHKIRILSNVIGRFVVQLSDLWNLVPMVALYLSVCLGMISGCAKTFVTSKFSQLAERLWLKLSSLINCDTEGCAKSGYPLRKELLCYCCCLDIYDRDGFWPSTVLVYYCK